MSHVPTKVRRSGWMFARLRYESDCPVDASSVLVGVADRSLSPTTALPSRTRDLADPDCGGCSDEDKSSVVSAHDGGLRRGERKSA